MKILTIGTFDLLHLGHVDFLKRCMLLGDLTVGINTDEFVERFKRRPIMNYIERRKSVEQLGFRVVCNDSAGRKLIEVERPDYIAVGSDWSDRDYYKQIDVTSQWLDAMGINVIYLPRSTNGLMISTSEIIRRIQDAET